MHDALLNDFHRGKPPIQKKNEHCLLHRKIGNIHVLIYFYKNLNVTKENYSSTPLMSSQNGRCILKKNKSATM